MIEQRANGTSPCEHPRQGLSHERTLAEEIVSVLTLAVPRVCSTAEETIGYTVRDSALRLRSILFDRASLRHLLRDRDRAVKIEYLKRDLLRCALHAAEYRYPRRAHSQSARCTKECYGG